VVNLIVSTQTAVRPGEGEREPTPVRARGIPRAQLQAIALQPWVWVAGLTLLGFLLRRIHLGTESLWFDEADIVAQARQPLSVLIEAFGRAGENGPLYTLMLHFWMGLYDNVPAAARLMHIVFGSSFEAPVRGISMLFGTAGIPAMYALARRVGGPALGLISAALLTFNPFDLWYSQDAKMYTTLVLMTLVTTLLYLRALEHNTRLLWTCYVVATWAMLTSHSLSGLVLLAQMVATPFLLRAMSRKAPDTEEPPNTAFRTQRLILSFVIILLPVLPIIWLRAAAVITGTVDTGNWYASASLADILLTIFVKFAVNQAAPTQLGGISGDAYIPDSSGVPIPWETIGALAMAALALTGAWMLIRRPALIHKTDDVKQQPGVANAAIVLALWVVPVLVFWIVTMLTPLFQPRYLIMALPPYLIMAAAGVWALRRVNVLLMALPLVLLGAATVAALTSINYSAQPQKEDWRGAMSYVQDHIRLRDVIIPFPGYVQTAANLYYHPGGPDLVPKRPISTISSLSTANYGQREMEDELRKLITCNERVWLVVSPVRAAREDPQNRVLQWFQYNFTTFDTQVFNGVTVYGIAFNSVYNCWSPNPTEPEKHTFENGIEFLGYIYELRDQSDNPVQKDASNLPLTLFWRTSQKLTEDYDIRIKVIDPSGQTVKDETLGPLNGYYPTTLWPINITLMDYRDLRLSGGLTPGDYTVTVQLYPQGQSATPLQLVGEGTDTIVFQKPLKIVPWEP
jgi:mannosyltransferase